MRPGSGSHPAMERPGIGGGLDVNGAPRARRRGRALLGAVLLALVVAAPAGRAAEIGQPMSSDGGASTIARFRARIPQLMADQGIPGLSVALVDGDRVLWAEGFGTTDGAGSSPITPDTMFSVQSMSKLFTATAVMQAVGAGRLDLDEPITTYLPDFTVHSAFEQYPERKITLRMLLSHTAGFTHEAPIGNNFDLEPGTFDEHVRSISDTWLRYPVGTGYAYSNLGIDVAGAILERTSGRPFADVMRQSLLSPLGMDRSTFDRSEIAAAVDRAIGHSAPAPNVPLYEPMTAAGGLYSSAADLARFLRFQLNDATFDGRTVLDPALMDEMRTIPAPNAGSPAGYALGVGRTRWRAGGLADLFFHGGGGFGFLSDLWWAPQLGVGVAVLTNSVDHHLQGDLALSILADLVHEPGSVYADRLSALPSQSDVVEPDGGFQPPDGFDALVAGLAMRPTGDEATRWASYEGAYQAPTWGVVLPFGPPPGRFTVESGSPVLETIEDGKTIRYRLAEIEPGLFLADNGETLDFRAAPPTWRNIELTRATGGPAGWQWAVLGAAALVAVGWFVGAAMSTLRRRRLRLAAVGRVAPAPPDRHWLAAGVAALTAVLALGAIALLAAVPGLVDSGFIGRLELPLAARLVLHVPLALAVATGGLVLLAAVGWARRWWPASDRIRYAALAATAVLLVVLLAAWRLIGWGLG